MSVSVRLSPAVFPSRRRRRAVRSRLAGMSEHSFRRDFLDATQLLRGDFLLFLVRPEVPPPMPPPGAQCDAIIPIANPVDQLPGFRIPASQARGDVGEIRGEQFSFVGGQHVSLHFGVVRDNSGSIRHIRSYLKPKIGARSITALAASRSASTIRPNREGRKIAGSECGDIPCGFSGRWPGLPIDAPSHSFQIGRAGSCCRLRWRHLSSPGRCAVTRPRTSNATDVDVSKQ